MLPNDVVQQRLRELPGSVQDYLYSDAAGELNDTLITRNGLAEAQEPALFGLLRELFIKEVPLPRLVDEVTARLGLEPEAAKKLALDVAGYRLLPLDKWLGDVDGYLRSLGGDPSAYPEFRVPIERRTPEAAAREVVRESVTDAADLHVQDRLENVVESLLAGARTEEQAREALMRSNKIGGLGFDEATAARVLDEVREEARSVIIDRNPPPEPAAPSAAAPAAEAPVAAPAPKKQEFATIVPEDEEEIERMRRQVLPAKGVEDADEVARRIEASIDGIVAAAGLKADDEAMAKRLRTVIGNRLRDVRDQMETLETMVQPKELGGLGLSQDAARSLLEAIRTQLRGVHEDHVARIAAEKTEWVEKEREKKADADRQAVQDDHADLERLYASIVSKSKKAVPAAAAPAPAPSAVPVPAPRPAAPPNLPVAVTDPIPPHHRPFPALPIPLPPPDVPVTIVRPSPSVPPPAPVARPVMQDVKPAARLTGPVEELRAITVVDFRRLSKDPAEAARKVREKVDVLAEQSFTRRNEAIAAWGGSEPVRVYLELMGEGLNGTPLKDAVAARQAAGRPYLTPEEFQAVAALSRQLRY